MKTEEQNFIFEIYQMINDEYAFNELLLEFFESFSFDNDQISYKIAHMMLINHIKNHNNMIKLFIDNVHETSYNRRR